MPLQQALNEDRSALRVTLAFLTDGPTSMTRLCRLHWPFPADPVSCFVMAVAQAEIHHGDFLCDDGQAGRGGDDPVA